MIVLRWNTLYLASRKCQLPDGIVFYHGGNQNKAIYIKSCFFSEKKRKMKRVDKFIWNFDALRHLNDNRMSV